MNRLRAALGTFLAVGLVALILVGCSGPSASIPAPGTGHRASTPAPGTGQSVADQVYNSIKPQVGEQFSTTLQDDQAPYLLLDRLMTATNKAAWALSSDPIQPKVESVGATQRLSYKFNDGSVLVFVLKDNPAQGTGPTLGSAEIVRP